MAGGAALNELLDAPRLSRDVDLFHDTDEALAVSWQADRLALERDGCTIAVVRERPTFVEAEVRHSAEVVVIQWTRDSAYRFFPLVEHPDLGLALHPFDLATNKRWWDDSSHATSLTCSRAIAGSSRWDTWRGRPPARTLVSVRQ